MAPKSVRQAGKSTKNKADDDPVKSAKKQKLNDGNFSFVNKNLYIYKLQGVFGIGLIPM